MSHQYKIWGRKCDSLAQNGTTLMMWDLFMQAFIFILFFLCCCSVTKLCLVSIPFIKWSPFWHYYLPIWLFINIQLSLSSVEKQHNLFPRAFELLCPMFNFCIAVNPQVRAEMWSGRGQCSRPRVWSFWDRSVKGLF